LFGHVQSMPDSRTVKIFNWTPLTARSKGRPKQRWEDNVIQDIRQMKLGSLCSGPSKMEKRRWEGQNSQMRKLSAWWRRVIMFIAWQWME
jgi:hypothetical protein